MGSSETHYLQIAEADYEGCRPLTLTLALFNSEAACIAAYDQAPGVVDAPHGQREYRLDRFVGSARVDGKFIAASTVIDLLGDTDLPRLHDQAVAALNPAANAYFD